MEEIVATAPIAQEDSGTATHSYLTRLLGDLSVLIYDQRSQLLTVVKPLEIRHLAAVELAPHQARKDLRHPHQPMEARGSN